MSCIRHCFSADCHLFIFPETDLPNFVGKIIGFLGWHQPHSRRREPHEGRRVPAGAREGRFWQFSLQVLQQVVHVRFYIVQSPW